jgi:hypothetical protein
MLGANYAPILRQDWHYLQMNSNEITVEPHHLGVPSSASKTNLEPMVRLAQAMHLSCTDTNTFSETDRNKIPQDPRHLGLPSSASKMFSEPMVCSAQSLHLFCVKISTISK